MARLIEQRDVVYELLMRLPAKQLPNLSRLERADRNFCACRAMLLITTEQIDELSPAVVHSDENRIPEYRPRHGMTLDAEIGLDIAHELQGVFACAIALVHEGEDRNPPLFTDVEELARSLLDSTSIVEK